MTAQQTPESPGKRRRIIKRVLIVSVVLLCAVIAMVLWKCSTPVEYLTETVDGVTYTYTLRENCSRMDYSFYYERPAISRDTTGALIIPSTLGGYPVTEIDYRAFYKCTNLTSVAIPESVTVIDGEAFYGCTRLTSFAFSDNVAAIGYRAFEDTGWYHAQPSNSVLYLGKWCIGAKGTVIGHVAIAEGTVGIAENAFFGTKALTSVTIPDGVTTIGKFAFACCRGLTSVSIPSRSASVEYALFHSCTSLTHVRYQGDAPIRVCTMIYCETPETLVSEVSTGSKGWDGDPNSTNLPDLWPLTGEHRRKIRWANTQQQ